MTKIANDIEAHRDFWADIARKNGWYREPLYIQVWPREDGPITDSVYLPDDATMDVIAEDLDEDDE